MEKPARLNELSACLREESTSEQDKAFDTFLMSLFEEFPSTFPEYVQHRQSALDPDVPYIKAFMACDTGAPNGRIIAAAKLIYGERAEV